MTIYPTCQYFIATGTITKAALIANSAYNLEAGAYYLSAIDPLRCIPDQELTMRPRKARITVMADGITIKKDGDWIFNWGFKYMHNTTFQWWLLTYLGSTLDSKAVTVQTMMDTGLYDAFQCTILRPVIGENSKPGANGLEDVVWRFVAGTKL